MAIRRKAKGRLKEASSKNEKASLKTYRTLRNEIVKTWNQLRAYVKQRNRKAIHKKRSHLLLLLGECNYIARELQKAR